MHHFPEKGKNRNGKEIRATYVFIWNDDGSLF